MSRVYALFPHLPQQTLLIKLTIDILHFVLSGGKSLGDGGSLVLVPGVLNIVSLRKGVMVGFVVDSLVLQVLI